jgi:uncharacterized protein (UPF0335 family)
VGVSEPGHNSQDSKLKAFVERIERLNAEAHSLRLDIREIYAEAKGAGYEPKIIRKVVALRMKDKEKLSEENQKLAAYAAAVGLDPFS